MTLQPSKTGSEVRKMPERWWIDICPECNGQVGEMSQAHTGGCPNGGPDGPAFIARTIEVVPTTWAGLTAILDAHYPEHIFDGSSGDPGSQIVVLARKLAEISAAAQAVAAADLEVDTLGEAAPAYMLAMDALRAALAPASPSGVVPTGPGPKSEPENLNREEN